MWLRAIGRGFMWAVSCERIVRADAENTRPTRPALSASLSLAPSPAGRPLAILATTAVIDTMAHPDR